MALSKLREYRAAYFDVLDPERDEKLKPVKPTVLPEGASWKPHKPRTSALSLAARREAVGKNPSGSGRGNRSSVGSLY